MTTINKLLLEADKKIPIEDVPTKDPEWIKAKNRCLVAILNKMNETKK